MTEDVWTDLVIAIPTFRRNDGLQNVLRSIETQTVRPAMVLVIDNNPGGDAKALVDNYKSPSGVAIEYLAMGRNAGPAGAFAAAVSYLDAHPGKPQWMACRDDDLPFVDADCTARLQALATNAPPSTAGVGMWGTHHFLPASVPANGPFRVDVIPGGGEPIYRIPALVGASINFDDRLFFGFEELDIGLRIRREGLSLLAEQLKPGLFVTGERRVADWRTYFGERNWILICREFEPFSMLLYSCLRAFGMAMKKMLSGEQRSSGIACLLGVVDGLRGAKPRPFYIP